MNPNPRGPEADINESARYHIRSEMTRLAVLSIALLVSTLNSFGAAYPVNSPDEKIQAVVEDGAQLTFTLKADGKILLEKYPVVLKTEKESSAKTTSALSQERSSSDSPKKVAFDIKKAGDAKYSDLTLQFKEFKLGVRVTDEAATCRFTVPSGGQTMIKDETFARPFLKDQESTVTTTTIGEEHVIVRGIRPEEKMWGPYQFPRPYNLGDRLLVACRR